MKKILKIQSEIGTLSKSETNPFFKSKYFDINGLLAQLQPILEKHEVTVVQPLTNINGVPALKTIVYDGDTEILNETIILPVLTDPQKMGSAITYYRRYSLQSLFLLQAEDDDGNKARPKPPLPQMTTEQEMKAIAWIKEGGDLNELSKKYSFDRVELLNKVNAR